MFQTLTYNKDGKVTGSYLSSTVIEAIEAGGKNLVVVQLQPVYIQFEGDEVEELPTPKKKRKGKLKGEKRATVRAEILKDEISMFLRGDDVEDEAREVIEGLLNDGVIKMRGKGRIKNKNATMKRNADFSDDIKDGVRKAKAGMKRFSEEKAKEYEENFDPRRRGERRKKRQQERQAAKQERQEVKPAKTEKEPKKEKGK